MSLECSMIDGRLYWYFEPCCRMSTRLEIRHLGDKMHSSFFNYMVDKEIEGDDTRNSLE